METNKNLNFGEKLVGLTFNPSGDERVQKVKELCAELANIVDKLRTDSVEHGTYNSLRQLLVEHCFTEILNTQMNVVKVLTLP